MQKKWWVGRKGSPSRLWTLERLPHVAVVRLTRHLRQSARQLRQAQLRARRPRRPRELGLRHRAGDLGRPRARECYARTRALRCSRAGKDHISTRALGCPRAWLGHNRALRRPGACGDHARALRRPRDRERPRRRQVCSHRGLGEGHSPPVRVLERRRGARDVRLRTARVAAGGTRRLWLRGVRGSSARRSRAGDGL